MKNTNRENVLQEYLIGQVENIGIKEEVKQKLEQIDTRRNECLADIFSNEDLRNYLSYKKSDNNL